MLCQTKFLLPGVTFEDEYTIGDKRRSATCQRGKATIVNGYLDGFIRFKRPPAFACATYLLLHLLGMASAPSFVACFSLMTGFNGTVWNSFTVALFRLDKVLEQ